MHQRFHRVCRASELAEGTLQAVEVDGWPVLVGRSSGEVFAVIDRCAHGESKLGGGRIVRGAIACPLHGAIFSLATGACIGPIKYGDIRVFETRQSEGWIEVGAPAREGAAAALECIF